MKHFQLESPFKPTGDQPEAIKQLVEGIEANTKHQTLLGVTGSGKTFTMANVIQESDRPTLILSHNKTLAAQLYVEFKNFFPNNAVEYFVSYYDYYQPEAFIPSSNTYIEKDMSINNEIERMRLSTVAALISGRRDVIVVSSVSCIYGMGNPKDIVKNTTVIKKGAIISRNKFLHALVQALYVRSEEENLRYGQFRVKGDSIDVHTPKEGIAFRISFFGNEVEEIELLDAATFKAIEEVDMAIFYPANIYVTDPDTMQDAIRNIQDDLVQQIKYFSTELKDAEAKRIEDRVTHDMEMMKELGYCSGIENYSRYFDRREVGERPYCLLDYFPKDFIIMIDESHVTMPQIRAMYGGDRARKINLVEFGFRLPSAFDNRPLQFQEFEGLINQALYVSATPANYELEKSEGIVAQQVIRPTGLLDPVIEVRPSISQIDDLLEEIQKTVEKDQRVLVTTLTKRMAEELTKYLTKIQVRSRYIHSDVETLDRIEILADLRLGKFDVLVGVNLLREGLDLPEVALVAILDADKEGFLRSHRALIQTIGRAARNIEGKAILYADKMTDSMQKTIDETNTRRAKQIAYNMEHNIIPTAIVKKHDTTFRKGDKTYEIEQISILNLAADPIVQYMGKAELEKNIAVVRQNMKKAATEENFLQAAQYRDELLQLEDLLKNKD